MDELVAGIFAAADGSEQALVDQALQTGTGPACVPITRGAPIIGGARDRESIGEDFEDASLVLLEARAAVAADKLFFYKNAYGFRPPLETALVKGRDDGFDVGFDVGLVFVEGNLRGGLFGSVDVLGEAALIQLAAQERENGRDSFDFFQWHVLLFLSHEMHDASGSLFADDGRQAGVGFSFFAHFAPIVTAQFTGLKYRVESGRAAQGAKLVMILAELA